MNKIYNIFKKILIIFILISLIRFLPIYINNQNNIEYKIGINNSDINNYNFHRKNKISSRGGLRYSRLKEYTYFELSVDNYILYFINESESNKFKEKILNIDNTKIVKIKHITYMSKKNTENILLMNQILDEFNKINNNKTFYPTISKNISSSFGYRISPTKGYYAMHKGIDISGNYGDNVFSYKSGIIEYASWNNGGYGNMILIKHLDGTESRYAHLSSILVSVGQNINGGELLGKIGSTGSSTGNHLHFEIIINGINVNPYNYIF